MIKYLLIFVLLFNGVASAQEVQTSDIIDPTKWNNVIYMNGGQLSQVEGAGGGPVPAFNTDTNTIRFSYFPYTVSQIIAINSVLSGKGITVSGFNYSWKIYNDLENCCGTRGSLIGNVNFFNNSGKLTESYTYDYSLTNTGADFKKFTGTETFNSPYQLNSLGDISISWTGTDMNFWSGYYGPRVRDTSLTLNYSIKQNSPTIPATTDSTTVVNDVITAAVNPVIEPAIASTVTNTSSATESPISSTTSTVTEQSKTERSSTGPSLSSILTNIRNNEQRQQSIAMTAVASANQTAMNTVEQADKIALASASASNTNTNSTTTSELSSSVRFNSIYALRPDVRLTSETTNTELSLTSEIKPIMLRSPSIEMFSGNTLTDNASNTNIIFGKKGDPIQDYIETNNQFFTENKVETRQSTVRQNVQDSDLAGGSRIERMAIVPNGFSVYTQFMLTNIAFYEPKDIYKNVVIKDNVRTMYFIEKSNTDTYNKMVDAQYK